MDYEKVSLSEMKCKCGKCNQRTNIPFFLKLNDARDLSTVAFVINSGDRCEEHNEKEGGSKTSSHLKGIAADIKATDDATRFEIIRCLLAVGFTRIGVSKHFVHVDDDKSKDNNVLWVY